MRDPWFFTSPGMSIPPPFFFTLSISFIHLSFLKKIYFYLEDHCFTILCWFLPHTNMMQNRWLVGLCCMTEGAQTCALRRPGAVGWGGSWGAGSRIVLLSCWKVGSGIHLWRERRPCQGVDWCRGPDVELASNVTLGTVSLTFLRSTFLRNKNRTSGGAAGTSQGDVRSCAL